MTTPDTSRSRRELNNPDVYRRQRAALIRFFECNDARDPADLADEVICRLLKTETKIENLPAFVQGIAKKVLLEHLRKREREQTVTRQAPQAADSAMAEELARNLDKCLMGLSRKERSLLHAFYAYEEGDKVAHRAKVAKRFNLSDNALRIRVSRIRNKLALCLQERNALARDHKKDSRTSSTEN